MFTFAFLAHCEPCFRKVIFYCKNTCYVKYRGGGVDVGGGGLRKIL